MAMAEAHQGGKQREGWGLDADIVEQALSRVSTQKLAGHDSSVPSKLQSCARALGVWFHTFPLLWCEEPSG